MRLSFPLAAVKVQEDILMEILVRLPASSLLRFKCVSKLWSSLISSRYFTNLFFNFSSSRRRRVFILWNFSELYSSSLCDLDSTASFPTLKLDMTFPCINNDRFTVNNVLRGLMCISKGREIQIINSTTRQILKLPLVESNLFLESDPYQYHVWTYLGYDPLNDEYKVLYTISSNNKTNGLRSETQVYVLVLGDGASWRNTKSLTFSPPPPHDPRSLRGISINGVLYYVARTYEHRSVLMSFDFSSEEFNLIEFPMEYHIKEYHRKVDLIHYQDHVAVFDDSRLITECNLNLWVLEDIGKSSKWSHKVLVLPCDQIIESIKLEDMNHLRIRGTNLKGKVTLSGRCVHLSNKGIYVFYDLENNRITEGFVLDQPRDSCLRLFGINSWEDAENIMYLEV